MFGGRSKDSLAGCGSVEFAQLALPGQPVQEHMPRQHGSKGQATDSAALSKAIVSFCLVW